MRLKTRRYAYGIGLAAVPLLIAYGALSETHAPLWVAMLGAVLVPGLALAHPTPEGGDDEPRHRVSGASGGSGEAGHARPDSVPPDKD